MRRQVDYLDVLKLGGAILYLCEEPWIRGAPGQCQGNRLARRRCELGKRFDRAGLFRARLKVSQGQKRNGMRMGRR